VATTTREGVALYYETTDEATPTETVAFVGEAGYGAWQWAWQHDAVAGPFEALVWDLRGTGRSDAPPGPYDVGTLAADLEAVLAASETRRAHLVGAGLGGMVALRHAREYDRTATLSLFGTAPDGDALDESAFRALYAPPGDPGAVRESLAGAFSDAFLDSDVADQICEWRASEDASETGFRAQAAAALGFETGPLYEQQLPTMVYHGVDDPVVSVKTGRELARALPRGTFEAVEGRHLCFIEHSQAVSDRLVDFLDEHARD
jgi:pimeloyl-ACP methyl ester carboxylesterase